jgi:two-component system chemotaxis response regulator CheV
MPLMDGFSLTKILKSDPRLRNVPVILYSSIITDELRHKGDSVGADMQIAKPDLERLPEMAIQLVAARDAKRSPADV